MTAHADQRAVATAPQEFGGAPLRHVAIIMDGNGRWAAERGLPRHEGHRRGVEAVRRTVSGALELGIAYLTLYSFSSENWSRPRDEVDFLFGLLRLFIRRDLADLHRNGVRVTVIGERATLHVVPDADHGFHVPKRSGRSDDEVLAELARSIAQWSSRLG